MARKEQIEELLVDLGSLKRMVASSSIRIKNTPAVTPSQWGVLMFIEHERETSVKDVAEALHISSSAATQLIDGLVENGYVVRKAQKNDRRAVSLTLSKKTQEQVAKIKRETVRKFQALFGTLTDAEFATYCALNKKIVRAAQRKHIRSRK